MKNNRTANIIIIGLAVVVAALVSVLTRVTLKGADNLPWDVYQQPKLHATLNSITAICLVIGLFLVKQGKVKAHRFAMMTAFFASGLFILSYVTYHGLTDPTPYGGTGVMKTIYSIILVTHIILAAIIFPLILMTIHRAYTNQIEAHRKLAKITFPIWLYVAITGVVVYLMLAPYYGAAVV